MKLIDRSMEEDCILHPESHTITAKWRILFEEGDLDSKQMLERFKIVNVQQRKKKNGHWEDGDGKPYDTTTFFQGSRTNSFYHDTTDPQKKMIILLVEKFLLDLPDQPMYKFNPNH